MRTTLTIDDDILMAAKGLAAIQHKSVGRVISTLARQALRSEKSSGSVRNGIPLLPSDQKGTRVMLEMVSLLSDDLP